MLTPEAQFALRFSLVIALATAVVNTVLGTFTAYVLSRYRFRGRRTLGIIVNLPVAIPTVVVGTSLPSCRLIGLLGRVLGPLGLQPMFAPAGVLLADLFGPVLNNIPADLYVPISFSDRELTGFGSMFNNTVVGRLRPGVSLVQAATEAREIARRVVAEVYPAQLREMGFSVTMTATAFREEVVGTISRILYVLMAAVIVVLLIATADIAGLMLTRAAAREREMAVRAALGADRSRLIRMMLIESGILAAIGGIVGLCLAWEGSRAFITSSPIELPRVTEISFDGRVVVFTLW